MLKVNKLFAHCPFLGHTGFANHARNFFTDLNKHIPIRVRNYTYDNNVNYLTEKQNNMLLEQSWNDVHIGTPLDFKKSDRILNIILMETNHFYFYDTYNGPKIAYNVWESTRQPENFFEKLKEFDQIWVPSEWQKINTVIQGIPYEKVFVVPEGIDLNRFKPIENNKSPNDKFQFMIFGKWEDRKYTKEMIQAFLEEFEYDDVELLLSVDNPFPVDQYKTTEERLEKNNLTSDKIKILHFPSDEEYTKYLQNGNVLLMVSRSEGWGISAIEALACGTPTLITNWGASLEYGKYAYKVKVKNFIQPFNVFGQQNVPGEWAEPDFDDLKKQMRYMYENWIECKEHTLSGIDYIKTFSWENISNIAIDIINNFDVSKWYPIKLNIGCGEYLLDDYINIDNYYDKADQIADARNLPYEENSVDKINSSHLLEHFSKYEIKNVLSEWYRVLKPNGELILEVPNFESIIKNWLKSDNKTGFSMDTIFGLQTKTGEEHKFGFTSDILNNILNDVGFTNINIDNIYSHDQDCFKVTANKQTIPSQYNDDIFVVDCFPNTDEKMGFLRERITQLKKYNKPIAIVSHLSLPQDILDQVDYFIFDRENPLSEDYSLTFWFVYPKKIKLLTSLTNSYHGLCCLTSMKNASLYLKDKYNFIHFIEYDMVANLDNYLDIVNKYRKENKKFIGFDYHYTVPRQDGLITNLFSFDIKWFDNKMKTLRKWNEYVDESNSMCARINKPSDMILEHWMWNYFQDKNMLEHCKILSIEDKDKIILKGNLKDQMDEEPDMHVRISETEDHNIVLFILRDDRVNESAKYSVKYNGGNKMENEISHGDIHWYLFKKSGIIEVKTENSYKKFEIDKDKIYDSTTFKFYYDDIKCIKWDSTQNEGFIDKENISNVNSVNTNNDRIEYSFIDGAKVEILGNSNKEYNIDFINDRTKLSVFNTNITSNHWCSPLMKYYVDWYIDIKDGDEFVANHKFDVMNKNVSIVLDSQSLGDTIAWVPYIDEFRKQKRCNVQGITFHNYLFKDVYPDIEWCEPGSRYNNPYAIYNVGCGDNDYTRNKNNWRSIPLQQVASDYLGLNYKEIRPKVIKSTKNRPIKEKYVAISEFSTIQCKFWLYPNGWQQIIEYLKAIGYKVMVVSKEKTNLKGIIDRTNSSMMDTINNIQHADLYIGVSSGPSWLAWALDVPVVLISGFSAQWGEFQDNCVRVCPPNGKCTGCFNDKDLVFDRGNWLWCPRSKDFECSLSITPKMVISGIHKFIK